MRDACMKEFDLEFLEQYYYAPSELDRQGGIWPLRMGRNLAKDVYVAKPRIIEYFSIHYIMEGSLYCLFGERQEIVLEKGDLFCLFPGVTGQYGIASTAEPLRMMWTAFDGPLASSLLELAGLAPGTPYLRQVVHPYMTDLLLQIMHEFKHARESDSYTPITGLLIQLLNKLIYMNKRAGTASAHNGLVTRSLDFIHAHYMESITVLNIAEYLGIHRAYLSEIFVRETGMPPYKYIQKLKMRKAEQLLKETNAPVTEIALSLGYPDVYSFTKAFTKYFTMPPGKMRKLALQ